MLAISRDAAGIDELTVAAFPPPLPSPPMLAPIAALLAEMPAVTLNPPEPPPPPTLCAKSPCASDPVVVTIAPLSSTTSPAVRRCHPCRPC